MSLNKLIIVGACMAMSVFGADRKKIQKDLESVPVPELPQRAVKIIEAAPRTDRQQTATEVVRIIVRKHPGIAPTLVSVISKAVPEVTMIAANAAVTEAPETQEAVRGVVRSQIAQTAPADREERQDAVPAGSGAAPKNEVSTAASTKTATPETPSVRSPSPAARAATPRSEPSRSAVVETPRGRASANVPNRSATVTRGPARYGSPRPLPTPAPMPQDKTGDRNF